MMVWIASAKFQEVYDLTDIALGLMIVINVIATILLTMTILNVTDDYNRQRAEGVEPEFNAKMCLFKVKPSRVLGTKYDYSREVFCISIHLAGC